MSMDNPTDKITVFLQKSTGRCLVGRKDPEVTLASADLINYNQSTLIAIACSD